MCVCVLSFLYHPSHPPVKSGILPYNLIIEASQFQPLCRIQRSPCQRKCMPRTSEVLLPFCVTNSCSFQYVPVVCMPSCTICGLFSQFDAISPVHLRVRVWASPWGQVLGTWLQEETLLEKSFQNTPSIWLTPWSSFCQGSAYSFALAEMLVMLANNCSPPPLVLEARNQLKKP